MANDNTTPMISITPPDVELWKAYLQYRDVKQQLKRYKKPQKYKITIELSIVESDSAEYSAEDELESQSETEEQPEAEFTDDESQKDTEDVENSLKKCCA